MSNGAKNIFISHIHEDDELLQGLKELLTRNGYEIRDSSIDSSKPNEAQDEAYIKSEILAPRIKWAGTVVVLLTPMTKESKYVEWEIEYAQKEGKRIVGVWAQGAQGTEGPENMELYADAVVGWQADRVMDAITGEINNWYGPDGVEHAPRKIDRYSCR
ncbi:MAG TPA: TIR domain-containing protein [Candidatus Acidoferrum sp.]|nr:TIR domain-containing protein [Candidatus Acidoferrum sp.]